MSSGVFRSRRSFFVPHMRCPRFIGNSRRGATMVMVAFALPALVCLGALAVDQGTLAIAAQKVQQTADVAALACAGRLPTSDSAALCLRQTIEANNEGWHMQVWSDPAQDLTWYGPGDAVPGHGVLESGEHAVKVVAHSQVEHTLGRAVGLTQTIVTRSAIAKVYSRGLLTDGFIFAGTTSSDQVGFELGGSSVTVNGTVQSNSAVHLTGSDNAVTGDLGYSYDFTDESENFTIGGEVADTQVEACPIDLTWDDFDGQDWDHVTSGMSLGSSELSLPGGRWKINGDLLVDGDGFYCSDALFLVTGRVFFGGSNVTLDRVTIVAKGEIHFTGSGLSHSPFIADVFALSERVSADQRGVCIHGAKCDSSGILLCPSAGIGYYGYQAGTYNVAFVGRRVALSGASAVFDGSGYEGASISRNVHLVG